MDADDGWTVVECKKTKKSQNKLESKAVRANTGKTLKDVHKKKQWAQEQRKYKSNLVSEDLCAWSFGSETIGDISSPVKQLRYIGGVDISFIKNNEIDACASFVVLSFPQLTVVYENLKMVKLTEPYIPSFLAFRECPPLVNLVQESLKDPRCPTPDILLIDGNGELHTRGYGAACHFGVLLSMPTIGVAKEYFMIKDLPYNKTTVAEAAEQHNIKQGEWLPLKGNSGKVWAAALRSGPDSATPIYVSVGHQISLNTAVEIVKRCSTAARVPEPIRRADLGSRQFLIQKGYNKRKKKR